MNEEIAGSRRGSKMTDLKKRTEKKSFTEAAGGRKTAHNIKENVAKGTKKMQEAWFGKKDSDDEDNNDSK